MCGIVGLFLKSAQLEPQLGDLAARIAVYDRSPRDETKICMVSDGAAVEWARVGEALAQAIGSGVSIATVSDHAIFRTTGDGAVARKWLIDNVPGATVLSQGRSIEIFKGVGAPGIVASRLGLAGRAGSHAIGHTRMATESAVTTAGSHPFSTGSDTCLVHNGSLSNHNRLRESLRRQGERFQTENDSEVAAAYLAWRTREGDSLEAALERAIEDLDGFYTFVVGTRDGFAVLRDPVACKPAVMAETDDWVAFGSEFRALAPLPGIDAARLWEPQPATVYAWSRAV
jgi:methylamine---glutamate N-methyltransferase subunit A